MKIKELICIKIWWNTKPDLFDLLSSFLKNYFLTFQLFFSHYKKSMALNKLCRSEQKFYLPTGSRLLFRIYDQRNLRSTFLPGLMIFVDDFAIELDETFAENLMPGEIDLTRYLENLNKFKIEVYWNDPSNTEKFYSWCQPSCVWKTQLW